MSEVASQNQQVGKGGTKKRLASVRLRRWVLRILTFGLDWEKPPRYRGSHSNWARAKNPENLRVSQICAAIRGAVIGARLAFVDGADQDHRMMLLRVQELVAELVRRTNEGENCVVEYECAEECDLMNSQIAQERNRK